MHRALQVLIAGLLVAGSGCAARHPTVSAAGQPEPPDSVILNVTNHLVYDVVVFVRAPTQSLRLGKVDAGSQGHFVVRVPWLYGAGVEFAAEVPVMYGGGRSGHLDLSPGDVVDWDLQANRIQKRATIRP